MVHMVSHLLEESSGSQPKARRPSRATIPASAKIDWIMGTGQNRTHMLYVTPDEKRIYTTNVSSGTVSILEKVTLPPMGPPPGMRPPPGSASSSAAAGGRSTAHGLESDRHSGRQRR